MRNFLKYSLLICSMMFLVTAAFSQAKNVGIGTSTPHPSAIVHLADDGGKGLKIPYTDTNAVIAYSQSFTPPVPIANGLLIFQKGAETFYYYDAPKNKWIPLSGITGVTGSKGATGPTGLTGPTGFGSTMRSGNGGPVFIPGDTCGSYYVDLLNAYMYKFNCQFGGWTFLGGSYKNNILGGETVKISSLNTEHRVEGAQNTTNMAIINNLTYNVVAPPGYTAMAWVHAYGAVHKDSINNDYNYAKFDIYIGNPEVASLNWQTVSMHPTGQGPEFHQDLVKWSISGAFNLVNGKKVEVWGGQQTKNKSGLGSITIAGGPGDPTQAHLEIMVIYVKN